MNIGFWSCIILVIPFLIIGVLFAIFKEKAAKFVSGFNSFSKEEQALKGCFDTLSISDFCFIGFHRQLDPFNSSLLTEMFF